MLSASKIGRYSCYSYLIYFIRCKFRVGRRRQLLPHCTSTAEAELAEGWRYKKILQALTSVTCFPSVFDTKGSDTPGHLSQAQISPPQEWVPIWNGTSLSLVMCQVLWVTSQRRTLGCSHKRSHKPSWNAVSPQHGQHQGTFLFTFLGRWLSFTALEACCVKLSQASNHSHHPSPKMLVSGVHPHTHCCRIKSWLLAAKLPAPCPASLHVHRGLREGPKQIRLS